MSHKVLSLCTGIGGFELAMQISKLEAQPVAFVEKDPHCQALIKLRFPDVPIFVDMKELNYEQLRAAGIASIDGIVGGIPCQPYSVAGHRQGSQDDRSLHAHFIRLFCEIGPKWAMVENVTGLLTIDSGRIARDLLRTFAQERYAAWWQTLSCAKLGGTHQRERVFITAVRKELLADSH